MTKEVDTVRASLNLFKSENMNFKSVLCTRGAGPLIFISIVVGLEEHKFTLIFGWCAFRLERVPLAGTSK